MWTRERMVGYLRRRLGDRRLIVVANREPYVHEQTPEGIQCAEPDSGLVSALDPILRATGGVWVAHGSGTGDRQASDETGRLRVPPGAEAYSLRRVWLNREEEEGFYYRCCHQGIWPLCHMAFHRPEFHQDAWDAYVRVNEKFAEAVAEEAAGGRCLVLVQNYHFALLPRLLRGRLPGATLCHFWHIPWPSPDVLRSFPWRKQLLDGLLGSDLVLFHLQEHCDSFLAAVRAEEVIQEEGRTRVRPAPISVDHDGISRESLSTEVLQRAEELKERLSLGSRRVLLSVGRFDYTEGVPERIRAFERLLELHPEYRGKIALVEVAVPIRGSLPTYTRFQNEAVSLIEEVNRTYGTSSWRPITVVSEHQSRAALTAFYRLSDVCLVTPLHDGMSLVAKEYISARPDGRGALVLSSHSGAARELRLAILVNPFDVGEMAGAMRHALEMSPVDRERASNGLRAIVRSRNVFRWAGKIFKEASAAGVSATTLEQDHSSHGKTPGTV